MKHIFLVLFSVCVILSLTAGTMSSDGSSLEIKKDTFSLDFSRYGVNMEFPSFSVGALDSSGILYSLDHPHENLRLEPIFSPVGKTMKTYGCSVRFKSLEAFAFYGKREGLGLSGRKERLSGSVLVAGGSDDSFRQTDLLLRRDFSTLYVLGEYKGEHFRLAPSFSVTETLLFSGLLAVDFSIHNMFISLSNGKLQSFLKNGEDYRQSVSLGYKDTAVSFVFQLDLGRSPVYSYEFRTYEADWKISARCGCWKFSNHVNKRFFKGKETRKESLSFSWKDCTFSLDTEKGISLSFLFGTTRIVLLKDAFSVETEFSKKGGALEWKLELSSEKVFDVKITVRI